MKFVFETDEINQRAYRRLINRYIQENFGVEMLRRLRDNQVLIRKSTSIGDDPFFPGVENGTGGVTTISGIRFYVWDVKGFGIRFRSNASTITHELAHMCLLNMSIGSKRVILRNDDLSGNRKGDLLNYSTAEVHDRQAERTFYVAANWLWNGYMWVRVRYQVIDFRDHIELV